MMLNRLLMRLADVFRFGSKTSVEEHPSLEAWAAQARAHQAGSVPGASAANLVLDDRARRASP